jgi:hypothetical protein
MNRRVLFIFSIGLLVVIVGVGVTVAQKVGLEQAYTAALTAALVWVTAFYAIVTSEILRANNRSVEATNRQVDASLRMANETREARADSLRPIIVLGRQPIQSGDLRIVPLIEVEENIHLYNVGSGPALNLVFYRYEPNRENPTGSFIGNQRFPVFSPNDTSEIFIKSLFGQVGMSSHDLVVEYEDVFGRKWRSGLELNYTQGEKRYTIKGLFYERMDQQVTNA